MNNTKQTRTKNIFKLFSQFSILSSQLGFTLVELIVVITILVILGTIGFLSFYGYSSGARDSVRISDLANIQKGLDIVQIKSGDYPIPENITGTGIIGGIPLIYVGNIGENISRVIGINKIPTDPLSTNTKYVYGISEDRRYYQLATVLENPTYQAKVIGNYKGIIKKHTTIYNPPSLLFSNIGTVTLTGTNVSFIANKSANLPYKLDTTTPDSIQTPSQILSLVHNTATSVTGITITDTTDLNSLTGSIGLPVDTIGVAIYGDKYYTEVIGNTIEDGTTCNTIKTKYPYSTDGLYWIKPDSDPAFQVYCDMTKDGGGWTRVVGINAANLNHTNINSVSWDGGNPNSYGKLSDYYINKIKSTNDSNIVSYRFTSVGKTVYFPGSCVFEASNKNVQSKPDCNKYKKNLNDSEWLYANYGDMCTYISYYGVLSSIKLTANCVGGNSDSGGIVYRRVDWRGISYDLGISGEVYVR